MAQLDDEAKKQGAQSIAVDTSLEHLAARREKFACLTLLDPGHFVLLYDFDDKLAYIVDPPRSYTLPIDTFRAVWSRKALLIGREPFVAEEAIRPRFGWPRIVGVGLGVAAVLLLSVIVIRRLARRPSRSVATLAIMLVGLASTGLGCGDKSLPIAANPAPPAKPATVGPWLLIEPSEHQLGDVARPAPGTTLTARTRLTNRGPVPLRISSIVVSCSCTTQSLGRDRLAPGESTEMLTTIRLGDSPEPRRTSLTITNSDPKHPQGVVSFTWRAVNPMETSPSSVGWMGLKPGQDRSESIRWKLQGLGLCPACRLEASAPAPIRCEVTQAACPVGSTHEKGTASPEGDLRLGLVAGLEPSTNHQAVALSLKCDGKERARLDLPVSWGVSPIIEVAPNRLSLGVRKPGEHAEARVVLRSTDGTPFRVTRVGGDEGGSIRGSRFSPKSSASQVVELDVVAPKAAGPWRVVLKIQTDRPGAESLELPVSMVVVGDDS